MKLLGKVTASVAAVFALSLVAGVLVAYQVILPQFAAIEDDGARKDMERVKDAILREARHLEVFCQDWASWDDMYAYVVNPSKDFEDEALNVETLVNAELDAIIVADTGGKHVFAWGSEDTGGTLVPELHRNRLLADHPLRTFRGVEPNYGVLATSNGPMLVASHQILTSEHAGQPRGVVIMGRLLDAEKVTMIAQQTKVETEAWPWGADVIPAEVSASMNEAVSGKSTVLTKDDDDIHSHSAVNDVFGNPAVAIRTHRARTIWDQGVAVTRMAGVYLLLLSVAVNLIILLFMRFIVIGPLSSLSSHARQIGSSGDLSSRLPERQGDELGALAHEFNEMADGLSKARSKLMEASRSAGMADISRGVIHNLGNALNSVGVAAAQMGKLVAGSKAPALKRVADLLKKNRDDIGRFLTQDDKGKAVLPYLDELAGQLAQENSLIQEEVRAMDERVKHMNEIIQGHRTFTANAESPTEQVPLSKVVEASLAIVDAAYRKNGIEIVRELSDVAVWTDRVKLSQVVVNLLTNAKDACVEQRSEGRRVRVVVRKLEDKKAYIDIEDNGVGIAPENLDRMFSQGFTTKQTGQGLGLHFSANALREMGGKISVSSAGRGLGATFTIEVPQERRQKLRKPGDMTV